MKKIFSILLSSILIITMLPMNAFAKSTVSVLSKKADITEDNTFNKQLEKAILAVKSKIAIPKELTEFDYDYDEYQSDYVWELTWSNEEDSNSITVKCDADQNIIFYYVDNDDMDNMRKPKYLKSELRSKADSFIKKVASNIDSYIQYSNCTFEGIEYGQYTYHYVRMANGIPLPENNVSVSVDYETGEVMSLYIEWNYDLLIPSKDGIITKEKAASIIGKNLTMELSYESTYLKDKNNKDMEHAYLVYQPDKSYISVDAKSGKVYSTKNEYTEDDEESYSDEKNSSNSSDNSPTGLTDKEIESLTNLKSLITKQEAIHKITDNNSLLFDKNLKSVTTKLSKSNYHNQSGYVWELNFTSPRSSNDYDEDDYRYVNAIVDAKTGKILYYSASIEDYYDDTNDKWKAVTVHYNEKQGQKILEDFVKIQMPEQFKKTVLDNSGKDYVITYKNDKPVYGGYYYNYVRTNENIKYHYQSINGSVDGVTGKVYYFSSNWNDNITFESTNGIITKQEAFDKYISNDGFHLVYEINTVTNYNKKTDTTYEIDEVRLVYRPDIEPNRLSPFTGEQIDSEGNPYQTTKSYNYVDIETSRYKREIQMLTDMEMSTNSERFEPDKMITKEEFNTILYEIFRLEYDVTQTQKSETITRMEAIKSLINIANLEKIAKLSNIYYVDYTDRDKIATSDLGYAAFAKGFGIVTENELRPNDTITKGESVDMIIHLLVALCDLNNN